ncbi:MAG: hypothetical protein DMF78_25045, partial [Acidobacteria bacterium]
MPSHSLSGARRARQEPLMGRTVGMVLVVAALSSASFGIIVARAEDDVAVGERPAIEVHLDQVKIESGEVSLKECLRRGRILFESVFNKLDGQGRPLSRGNGVPRGPGQPAFIRTSGPEANSCLGCHAQPRSGGGGDFVANVFVLAQTLDPVTSSVDGALSNERNTLAMMGAGP